MLKETIVCIVIIAIIIVGNVVTQNITNDVVNNLNGKLDEVKVKMEEVSNNQKNGIVDANAGKTNDMKDKIEEMEGIWKKEKNRLAYYIEHDELEKVEKDIVGLKTNVNMSDYEQAMADLEDGKFILEHIQDKYAFTLQNIF